MRYHRRCEYRHIFFLPHISLRTLPTFSFPEVVIVTVQDLLDTLEAMRYTKEVILNLMVEFQALNPA